MFGDEVPVQPPSMCSGKTLEGFFKHTARANGAGLNSIQRKDMIMSTMTQTELPFLLETALEHQISEHPDWLEGIEYGRPRRGHPEGAVKYHIADVLRNVDQFFIDSPHRATLRLIALVHDSFKFQVDRSLPRIGDNHHAMIARRFAEQFISDGAILDVIELHDEAFNAWQCGNRDGRWDKSSRRALALVDRLGGQTDLYLAFYRCDNATTGKDQNCYDWFEYFVQNCS